MEQEQNREQYRRRFWTTLDNTTGQYMNRFWMVLGNTSGQMSGRLYNEKDARDVAERMARANSEDVFLLEEREVVGVYYTVWKETRGYKVPC